MRTKFEVSPVENAVMLLQWGTGQVAYYIRRYGLDDPRTQAELERLSRLIRLNIATFDPLGQYSPTA
jgi:hypothetical protein